MLTSQSDTDRTFRSVEREAFSFSDISVRGLSHESRQARETMAAMKEMQGEFVKRCNAEGSSNGDALPFCSKTIASLLSPEPSSMVQTTSPPRSVNSATPVLKRPVNIMIHA